MIKRFFQRYRSLLLVIFSFIILFFLMNNLAFVQFLGLIKSADGDARKYKIEYLIRDAENVGIFTGRIKNVNQNYFTTRDSINYIKDWTVSRLRAAGEGVATGIMGAVKLNECDSCYSFDKNKFSSEYKDKYFIRLSGYTMEDPVYFFIENDKYYIKYFIADSIGADGYKSGHMEKKEVPVRYSIPLDESTTAGSLLIPVSPKTYRIMNTLLWILTASIVLLFAYIFLVLSIRTLYRIARGQPFTKRNIRRLYTIAWALLAIPILPPLISVVVGWFLRNKIPAEFYYPFFQSILDGRQVLLAGLVVLLIAYAFNKGYKLQQDQDLTI